MLRDYRQMVWVLREHEGWRAVRWPAGALGSLTAVWALLLAGGSIRAGRDELVASNSLNL